ncbi:hypothetical protein ACX40Y_09620 [Sphingomonas sp. RS6]
MRSAEFRAWLKRRTYKGQPLNDKAITTRVGKLPRVERALADLGFDAPDLDTGGGSNAATRLCSVSRTRLTALFKSHRLRRIGGPSLPSLGGAEV